MYKRQDLGDFTKALGLDETDKPLVTLAHDWGGLVSFGWALEHREILSGVMLTNTAVYHDGIENIPAALRLALGVHEWGTHDSTAFIDVTLGLAQNEGRLPAPGSAGAGALDGALPQPVGQQPKRLYPSPLNEAIYRTYRAPYAHSAWREGVRNFVGDIPTAPISPRTRRCSVLPSRFAAWMCPHSSSGVRSCLLYTSDAADE